MKKLLRHKLKQRIFNLTLAVIGLAACLGCGDDEYELPKEYRESYISCYYPITGLNLYPPTVKSMSGPLDFSWQFETEWGNILFYSLDGRYRELAERNGDTGYDRYVITDPAFNSTRIEVYDRNFESVEVFCRQWDWDEQHPVGSSLDDIATITLTGVSRYVYYDYDPEIEQYRKVRKRSSELTREDLSMICNSNYSLYVERPAEKGVYMLELIFTDTEGETFSKKLLFNYKAESSTSGPGM
ncbi:hypothetical protein [uncultured Alistipes sp.]|uniref:hypothetical protein n=1 Tax=uncultured Alistipes sp. TaxID=538949 RepID=UPI0026702961|nr:hypothetical protein [uncultured Alistipes sp.]